MKKMFRNFLMKVSGESHSAQGPKESLMLGKRFVSSKNLEGFDENKLENSRIEKKTLVFKKIQI